MDVSEIKKKSKITKIVCRRTIRGVDGDKMLEVTQDCDNMTQAEAEFSATLLSMQVDMAALKFARASGVIPPERFSDQMSSLKSNYGKLITDMSED